VSSTLYFVRWVLRLAASIYRHAGVAPSLWTSRSAAVAVEELSEAALTALTTDWRHAPDDTRALTRAWFGERRTALLRVPSATVPAAFNYLLNPLHPEAAQITAVARQIVQYDARLFGQSSGQD